MPYSIRLVAFLHSCLCFGFSASAQSENKFEVVMPKTLSPYEAATARARILELPAAGASQGELAEFFHARKLLSERLGDLPATEQFPHNLIEALPNDWQAQWNMAKTMVQIGKLTDFFPYAQSAIKFAPNRPALAGEGGRCECPHDRNVRLARS